VSQGTNKSFEAQRQREPLETQDAIESPLIGSEINQSEDMPALRPGLESILKKSKEKIIN
jgi:hypothetical protein